MPQISISEDPAVTHESITLQCSLCNSHSGMQVNDGERRNLVGGQSNVTLTDSAAERRPDRRKSVAMRLREPAFDHAIELHERQRWVWHPSVRDAVDAYYSGEPHKVKDRGGVG